MSPRRGEPLPTRPCVGRSNDFRGYLRLFNATASNRGSRRSDWHRASREPLTSRPCVSRELLPSRPCVGRELLPTRPCVSRGQLPTRPCVGRSNDFRGYLRLFNATASNRGSRRSDWHRASRELLMFRPCVSRELLPSRPCVGRSNNFRGYMRLFNATASNRGSRSSDWHRASREPLPSRPCVSREPLPSRPCVSREPLPTRPCVSREPLPSRPCVGREQ
jgi:hypothetical protein